MGASDLSFSRSQLQLLPSEPAPGPERPAGRCRRWALCRRSACLAVVLLAACDGGGPGGGFLPTAPRGNATSLPASFRLTGTAEGTDSGVTVKCSLELFFELPTEVRRTSERIEYAGSHGGGVERTVLERDGSGFSFLADVAGAVEAHLLLPGLVELHIPVNRDVPSRFWRNLARFDGAVDDTGRGQGRWTCAPLDVDSGGYRDDRVIVTGTWELEPTPGL